MFLFCVEPKDKDKESFLVAAARVEDFKKFFPQVLRAEKIPTDYYFVITLVRHTPIPCSELLNKKMMKNKNKKGFYLTSSYQVRFGDEITLVVSFEEALEFAKIDKTNYESPVHISPVIVICPS